MALTITRVGDTIFDFQEDSGVVKTDGQPTLTTLNLNCDFKTGTGSNLYQQIPLSEITVIDDFGGTGSFTFTTILNLRLKLIELKFFEGASGVAGGGVLRFDQLLDTFLYQNNNGKTVVVNESQLRLDAVDFHNVSLFTQLKDVPSSIIKGKILEGDENGKLIFVNKPSEPQQFYNSSGFLVLHDGGTLQNFTTGDSVVSNDLSGVKTTFNYRPYQVNNVFNGSGSFFYFSDLRLGDKALLNLVFDITTTVPNQLVKFKLRHSIGTPNEDVVTVYERVIPAASLNNISFNSAIEIFENEFKDSNMELIFESNDSGVLISKDWRVDITRRDVNEVVINDYDSTADHYKESYNADTNTPVLSDITGRLGDYYVVDTDGVIDLGSGNIDLKEKDIISHNGSVWYKKVDNNQSGGTPFQLDVADKDGAVAYSILPGEKFKTKGFVLNALTKTIEAEPHDAKKLFLATSATLGDGEPNSVNKPFKTLDECVLFLENTPELGKGWVINIIEDGNYYLTEDNVILNDFYIINLTTANIYLQTGITVNDTHGHISVNGELIFEITDNTVLSSSSFIGGTATTHFVNVKIVSSLDSQITGTITQAALLRRVNNPFDIFFGSYYAYDNTFLLYQQKLQLGTFKIGTLLDNIDASNANPLKNLELLGADFEVGTYINNSSFNKLVLINNFVRGSIILGDVVSPNALVTLRYESLILKKDVDFENVILSVNFEGQKCVVYGNGYKINLNSPLATGAVVTGTNRTKQVEGLDYSSYLAFKDVFIDIDPLSNYNSFILINLGLGWKGQQIEINNTDIRCDSIRIFNIVSYDATTTSTHQVICRNAVRFITNNYLFNGTIPVGLGQNIIKSLGASIYHDFAQLHSDPNFQTTVPKEETY